MPLYTFINITIDSKFIFYSSPNAVTVTQYFGIDDLYASPLTIVVSKDTALSLKRQLEENGWFDINSDEWKES